MEINILHFQYSNVHIININDLNKPEITYIIILYVFHHLISYFEFYRFTLLYLYFTIFILFFNIIIWDEMVTR